MMMNFLEKINKATNFYKKIEIYISVFTFSSGLILTFMTLNRVDMFIENFWIAINLLLVFVSIFTLTLYENKLKAKNISDFSLSAIHFYLTILIQFAFGGLFATFFVFYWRSSSFSNNWPFILALFLLLVGNEIWKKHYARLAFQISVLFISIYLFLIFLLPVLFHRLGADLFFASGLISLIIVFLFTLLLRRYAREKFNDNHKNLKVNLTVIFLLINILYFANIIPPIPLALKETGIYHQIQKVGNVYEVKAEHSSWTDYFKRYPVFHQAMGETVYVYSAIFSPVNFSMEIIHEWQYYDEEKGKWVESVRIPMSVVGGREGGYRTYSFRRSLTPGFWRVKVITTSNKVLGIIKFKAEGVATTPVFITEIL